MLGKKKLSCQSQSRGPIAKIVIVSWRGESIPIGEVGWFLELSANLGSRENQTQHRFMQEDKAEAEWRVLTLRDWTLCLFLPAFKGLFKTLISN